MKIRLHALSKYFGILYKRLRARRSWQLAFNSQRAMMGYLLRLPIILSGRCRKTDILAIVSFVRYTLKIKNYSGLKGLAIYLKTAHIVLVRYVAGRPVKGVATAFKTRVGITGKGIPRIIPAVMRADIDRGDAYVIKFWLSLFSLYRVLEFKGKINLKTITDPGKKVNYQKYKAFLPFFFSRLGDLSGVQLKTWAPELITKSGPGAFRPDTAKSSKAPMLAYNTTTALIYQARAFQERKFSKLLWCIRVINDMTGSTSLTDHLLAVGKLAKAIPQFDDRYTPRFLGKLGIKEEPGKVRVFAMVDWWTQMALRPVHDYLFSILKRIKEDCTFNQDLGVIRGRELMKKTGFAASYDLSAATDRLPIDLQVLIFDHLFNGTGNAWKTLLVGRKYEVPHSQRKLGIKLPKAVSYGVGQPMGALSSWAMLALTHHFIVQYAAWTLGYVRWFRLYLVLGDDIVIYDREVAQRYVNIMTCLGVGINYSKTVLSETTFEFAKRIIHRGEDLSPVSFKEMDVASVKIEAAVILFNKVRKGWTPAEFAKYRGFKYRALSTIQRRLVDIPLHLRNLLIYLSMPGISVASFDRVVDWLRLDRLYSYCESIPSQGVIDRFRSLYASTEPIGYDPDGSFGGYFISPCVETENGLRKISLWYPTKLDDLEHWRATELAWRVHSIIYPVKEKFLADNKESDKSRGRLDGILSNVQDWDSFEEFLSQYVIWDAEASLVPKERDLNDHRRDDELPKDRVSRWLRWFSYLNTH